MIRRVLLALLLLATTGSRASEPFTSLNVVLLQPSAVMEARVPSIDAMADYLKAVQVAAREAVVASSVRQAVGGYIVIAVRPGLKSKVWLDFDALLDLALKQQLTALVQAVPPFEVRQGPVVFALKVTTWGGKAPRRLVPAPQEWKQVTPAGAPLEVGELVEALWPD
jgi:hypothetical protein